MIRAKLAPVRVDNSLTWVEIDADALRANLVMLRVLVGRQTLLCPTVKSNAYGHGLIEAAQIFRAAGAEYLAVNNVFEARQLRAAGDTQPIYVMGYTLLADLPAAVRLGLDLVVYNRETVEQMGVITKKLKPKKPIRLHLKIECGVHRQGVMPEEVVPMADLIRHTPGVRLAGVAMHFANIEDTTDHTYARYQLAEFQRLTKALHKAGHSDLIRHTANSAATLLWGAAQYDMVRPGIAIYGMWPSDETFASLALVRRKKIILRPALTWKTRIAQVKVIPAGAKVGYGCTWQAPRETRLAIVPVGYYDGYARAYSGQASVLIRGHRAPVVGRVCMNIIMVDVTDIPGRVTLEDEVVLLGRSNDAEITAEEMGGWGGTINYEVTTRIRENIERRIV